MRDNKNKKRAQTYQDLFDPLYEYLQLVQAKLQEPAPTIVESMGYFFSGRSATRAAQRFRDELKLVSTLYEKSDFIRLAVLLWQISKNYRGKLADDAAELAKLLVAPLRGTIDAASYLGLLSTYFPQGHGGPDLEHRGALNSVLRSLYISYLRHLQNLERHEQSFFAEGITLDPDEALSFSIDPWPSLEKAMSNLVSIVVGPSTRSTRVGSDPVLVSQSRLSAITPPMTVPEMVGRRPQSAPMALPPVVATAAPDSGPSRLDKFSEKTEQGSPFWKGAANDAASDTNSIRTTPTQRLYSGVVDLDGCGDNCPNPVG